MLVDTNVLLDFATGRERSPVAREVLRRIERTSMPAFVAWHSISTFYYIVERDFDRAAARAFVVELTGFLTVVTTGHESILYALSLPIRDFEDAMQVAAAQVAGAQHIITRDLGDFANSPIPAIAPEQALRELF